MDLSNNNNLSVIQWNSGGLSHSKLQEFKDFLHDKNPHIVLLSETHWKENKNKEKENKKSGPVFNGYNIVRADRKKGKGGGVAILIHTSISFKEITLPKIDCMEIVGVSISTDSGLVDFISVYCPRGNSTTQQVCQLFDAPGNQFVIGGDFNAHHQLWEKTGTRPNRGGSSLVAALTEVTDVSLLTPKNLNTRMCPQTAKFSTIDLTFSSAFLSLDADIKVGDHLGSDHLPVFISLNTVPKQATSRAPKWLFDDKKWDQWNRLEADRLNDVEFLSISEPDTAHQTFYGAIMSASLCVHRVSKFDPSQQKQKPPVWYKEQNRKNKSLWLDRIKIFRDDQSTENLLKMKKAEGVKKKYNRKCQSQSWVNHISSLDVKNGQSKVWSFTKNMLGRGNDAPVDCTTIRSPSGELLFEPKEKAELFRSVFDVSSGMGSTYTECHPKIQECIDTEEPNLLNTPILMSEIDAMISALKLCAMGADKIHNQMLMKLNAENKKSLLHLFNRLLATGFVPKQWKEATVIPLLKPGKKKEDAKSYRPISLTSCLCKAFERIINNRLTWFVESKGILPNFQSGFRRGRSTVDNLVSLEQEIRISFNQSKNVYAIFLDITKAYDLLWIPGLLHKLANIGVTGSCLKWIKSFLTDRSFCVRIGDHSTDFLPMFTGVPQGSILSPLLFNIMLMDFPGPRLGIKALLYADDFAAYLKAKTADEAERRFNPYLGKISAWAKLWRFTFSIEKCAAIAFSRERAPPMEPLLFLSGHPIPMVKSFKFLGLIFDRKLLWKEHVQSVILRVVKTKNLFAVLTKHKRGPNLQCLLILFKTLVRSIVDYGLIVYGAACASSIEKIDVVLRSIMRLILGAFKSTPVSTLYAELGLEPTADRRTWLAAKYVLNLSNKPSNAAYPSARSVMYGGYVWKPRSIPCLNAPMQQLYAHGWSGFELEPEYISPPNAIKPPAPWTPLPFDTKFFPWSKEKAIANKAESCRKIQEWSDSLPAATVFFYTDGSVCSVSDQVSCAFFSPTPLVERAWSLSTGSSIFSAEVTAIVQVLSYVYNLEDVTDEICIFTDSKSVVQAISASKVKSLNPACLQARHLASCLKTSGTKVTIAWIPSHIGVPGNEKADELAVGERQSPSGAKIVNSLDASECAARFKKVWQSSVVNKLQQECLKDTVQCRTSLGVFDWQFDKNRQNSVALHRIRTGHNLLNKYQFRLDEGADPSCRFGCEKLEDAEHLLLHCPVLDSHRRNLVLFFSKNNIDLNFQSITGCNLNLDRNTQLKIRDKVISFFKVAKIRHLI